MNHAPSRTIGLDAFRLLAALSIISLHVGDYEGLPKTVAIAIRLGGRWAVPFFFMITGYFLAPHMLNNPNKVAAQSVKAFWVFVVATICLIPLSLADKGVLQTIKNLATLSVITDGSYFHLWFLSSLAVGLFVFFAFQLYQMSRAMTTLVAGSVFCLLLDAYYPGSHPLGGFARYLLCFPFIYAGMVIRLKGFRPSVAVSLAACFLGCVLQGGEALLLWKYLKKSPLDYDFLVGTIPYAIGVFLLALALSENPSPHWGRLAVYGRRYSLGIYVFHPYFLHLLREHWPGSPWLHSICVVPLVFCLSLLFLIGVFRILPFVEGILSGNRESLLSIDSFIPLHRGLPRVEGS
jgi:surface polysaccharide O-acyltransferase-like enzyme